MKATNFRKNTPIHTVERNAAFCHGVTASSHHMLNEIIVTLSKGDYKNKMEISMSVEEAENLINELQSSIKAVK